MASDSEECGRMWVKYHDTCQDSAVGGADDFDDVDGSADAAYPALKFRERGVADKIQISCPGCCENRDSLNMRIPVSDPESSFRANHLTAFDSSGCAVDQKFDRDALVNGNQGCVYENDCSSALRDEVPTADNGFSTYRLGVNEDFLSLSVLFKEPMQSTGSPSSESCVHRAVSEIQNDLTDLQCSSPRISDVWPNSNFCSHKYLACDCPAVQGHGAHCVSNEVNSDLPKSRCAVKSNDYLARVIDANDAGSECVKRSSIVEKASRSVVYICRDPHFGGADGVNCDGFEHEGNGCDVEENDEFYANSFPRLNSALVSSNSQSNTEECLTNHEEQRIENFQFQECPNYGAVTRECHVNEVESLYDEDEDQKNEDLPHIKGGENEENSNRKEPKESRVEEHCEDGKHFPCVLEAHGKTEDCSEDEEETRNDQPLALEEVELPENRNAQERKSTGDDRETWHLEAEDSCVIAFLENSHLEMTLEQRYFDKERSCEMERLTNHVLLFPDGECLESSFRGMAIGVEKPIQRIEEYANKDMQYVTEDIIEERNGAELKDFEGEKNKKFLTFETRASKLPMNGVLCAPKEVNGQEEIEEVHKIDKTKEEMQSYDERKEVMYSYEEKEEMESDEEKKENEQGEEKKKEEEQDKIESDEGKKETGQSEKEKKEDEKEDENEEMLSEEEEEEEEKGEMHSGEEKREEEIQSVEEGKVEIQSVEEEKDEMRSDELKKENKKSEHEGNEEKQAEEEEKEELQCGEGMEEEMQSDEEIKEEMQSDDEGNEELQIDDEGNEEQQSENAWREMSSDEEKKEDKQNDEENGKEMQSDGEKKEEMVSNEGKKEEMHSDDEGNAEMQCEDEKKREMQSSEEMKELQSDGNWNEALKNEGFGKEEMRNGEVRKENIQSDEEKNEELKTDAEGNEELQCEDKEKEKLQSEDTGKEEIQSADTGQEEIQSKDTGQEEIQSEDTGQEEIQSEDTGQEEIQSEDTGQEEIQSCDDRKKEIQSCDDKKEDKQSRLKEKEEIQIDVERREEIQSEDSVKEEIKSEDTVKEEIQSEDTGKEEIQSEDTGKEEMQSEDTVKEEIQSEDRGKEEIQSCSDRKEELQSELKEKEEIQVDDERREEIISEQNEKEEIQIGNGKNEIHDDASKIKGPAFLVSPPNRNFHTNVCPLTLSRTGAQGNDEEKQLQNKTTGTDLQVEDVRDEKYEDMVKEEQRFGDGIDDSPKYGNDKSGATSTNLPSGLHASEKKNHHFTLNLGISNIAAQASNNNSQSYRVEMKNPGKKKAGQSTSRGSATRFCPLNLDYRPLNEEFDNVFDDEKSGENCNSNDLWKSRCRVESKEKIHNPGGKIKKPQRSNLSFSAAPPRRSAGERAEFNDIPEQFLVPPVRVVVNSNNIMTPQEDLGFAKVPGYIPRLDSMEEESEEVLADSEPEESIPTEKQEIDEVTVGSKPPSASQICKSELAQYQSDSMEEKQEEEEKAQLGARPKDLPSSLQLPVPPSALPQLSPKLQLSPKPQSKSARPNSLVGLSKPDVNLPSPKPVALSDATIEEDVSSELIRVKRQDIPFHSQARQRFSFPTCGKSASLLTSPSIPDAPEADTDRRRSTLPASLSLSSSSSSTAEVAPASEARTASLPRPPSQRPTSWSQPTLKTKSVLPKRPNSLNITVSNATPMRTDKPPGIEPTTLGLQVPQGTPCLAGSMVVAHAIPAVILPPPCNAPLVVPPRDEECNKSHETGLHESSIQDSPASVSTLPPPISSNINLRITDLGKVAPVWVPDGEAPRCMQCESRFTFTRRRHHCRTCGKVFCSGCCNVKVKLGYLDQKEGRVCSRCYQDLLCAQLYENLSASASNVVINPPPTAVGSRRWSTSASSVPLAARGAPMGNVLKGERSVEPKPVSVLHSGCHDNSRETDGGRVGAQTMPGAAAAAVSDAGNSKDNRLKPLSSSAKAAAVPRVTVTAEVQQKVQPMTTGGTRTPLWPDCNGLSLNVAVMTEASVPSKFTLLPNLKVKVSIVNLDCCMGRVCWCFVTSGLCAVGQDEVVIVLERLPNEERIPSDIFHHICDLYHEAAKGKAVGYLGHKLVSDGQVLLESSDHAGFLYLRPTFQCLQKLPLPPAPYLFGILIHRMEVPWLQVFPIRLMLRLGAQYRYYPCPLVSIRFRETVYREVGHTIMNLLVDLRNFQYRLPRVDGLVVHMEDRKTFINLPRSRFRDIKRAFNNNNDHIVALEVSFSCVADSHLVCFQNPEGKYVTQAINIQNRPRKITGASFVVFNGALRPILGMHAKCSMVEDGLMVQVAPESMLQLKQSISRAEDFSIGCGWLAGPEPEEWVILKWVDEEKDAKTRPLSRIRSPIDGLLLDNARSRRISSATDYVSRNLSIRWTEIFYLENPADSRRESDAAFEEVLAQACCMALCLHLEELQLPALTRIGLRVTLGSDQFGYKIGANGEQLSIVCLSDLDSKLIPVLEKPPGCYKGASSTTMELSFYLLEQQSQHLSPEP